MLSMALIFRGVVVRRSGDASITQDTRESLASSRVQTSAEFFLFHHILERILWRFVFNVCFISFLRFHAVDRLIASSSKA